MLLMSLERIMMGKGVKTFHRVSDRDKEVNWRRQINRRKAYNFFSCTWELSQENEDTKNPLGRSVYILG